MANGDTIQEIKGLLSEKGAIKTPIALRLTLDISAQIYDKLTQQEERIKCLEDRVEKVERNSIMIWIQNNPKLAVFILTLYIALTTFYPIQEVFVKALGIK
jgi:hypothetical protein